jgi:folate-dependent phosphoribosylglycinamide formyltransferase PurN
MCRRFKINTKAREGADMGLRPLHDPQEGTLGIVGLMSGSGTNIRRILEHQDRLLEQEGRMIYEMKAIFSDTWNSKAVEIGRDFDLPVILRDIAAWYQKRGAKRTDIKLREQYDRETIRALSVFQAKVAVYGGYMSLATRPLIEAYIGVNVHPADLSIEEGGSRKWTGAHAVRDAIEAGEKFLRSSTHLIEPECDMGRLFMISKPLPVEIPQGADIRDPAILQDVADRNQERLKEKGDWVIFPRTIEAIARGLFQRDEEGNFFYQNQPVPRGLKLD